MGFGAHDGIVSSSRGSVRTAATGWGVDLRGKWKGEGEGKENLFHEVRCLELGDIESDRHSVGVELDKKGVGVFLVEVSSGKAVGDNNGNMDWIAVLFNFKSDNLRGSTDFTSDENTSDLVFVACKAPSVGSEADRIENRGVKARGFLIDEPISSSEDNNKNDRSNEESLGINA